MSHLYLAMSDGASPPPDARVGTFRSLYDATYHDLLAYCRRRVGDDDADEVVNEAYLVAWRRLETVPPGGEARLWLFGVARNLVANRNRGERRQTRLRLRLVDESRPMAPDPAPSTGTEPVLDALNQLNDEDRELLRLLAWEELSHAEIATVLGCSTNAVGIRAHRARRRLASALRTHATSERSDD